MKVLIINGGCLYVNSSANLCHKAYIEGFLKNGYEVTVLSASEKGEIVDDSIVLPKGPIYKTFEKSILYNFIKPNEWKLVQKNIQNNTLNLKTRVIKALKNILSKAYGPFGYNGVWVRNVVQYFGEKTHYNYVVSLSSPVYSHLAAIKLIENKKISCDKFIEIWEDPWQLDLYNEKIDYKLLKLEHKLLKKADSIVYVSPLTAKYQMELFPDCKSKITWAPLPYYYKDESIVKFDKESYGYFGDYYPISRNLAPFYEAAKEKNLYVEICGAPDNLFQGTDTVKIFPRLPLSELREHENRANILVFVCNLKGGQIPGKIYQYSATRKKILFILDGTDEEILEIQKYFSKYNRYVFCRNNKENIIQAIDYIHGGLDDEIQTVCVEEFSPANIVKSIMKCNRQV